MLAAIKTFLSDQSALSTGISHLKIHGTISVNNISFLFVKIEPLCKEELNSFHY